jgi:hypothetical protein
MMGPGSQPADPRVRDVMLLAIGVAGLVACITLVFLAMRAVMDVGGACADGGPYVSAQSCPEGSAPAMLLGIFGGFGFGALALVTGARVGGLWTGTAVLIGWSGLFAALGWNFLDYGLINPPQGQGIDWGWLIPGILFEAMALGPVVFALWVSRGTGAGSIRTGAIGSPRRGMVPGAITLATPEPPPIGDPPRSPAAGGSGAVTAGSGAVTADLVAHLERLAELRDRGLLAAEEYEVAKDAIMRDLAQPR